MLPPKNAADPLVDAVQQLALATNLETITAIVRSAARSICASDGATFVLRDGDFCFYADEDAITPLWKGQRFPLENCIGGWVMNSGESVVIPNVFLDPRVPVEFYRPTFVRSLAMVPIRTQSPVGVIGSYWARNCHPPPERIRILQALADSTAVAMENIHVHQEIERQVRQSGRELEAANSQLRREAALRKEMESRVKQLSLTDELTGLNNRRGFLLHAEQMLKLVHRIHTQGWLIGIGLDGWKQIDDRQCTEAGDRLMVRAAKVLGECFRDSDVVARIGGDDFVVFATGAYPHALDFRDRIARSIENHNRCYPDQPPIAMSIGIVRCDLEALPALEDAIDQAVAAMNMEKRRKRECIENSPVDSAPR